MVMDQLVMTGLFPAGSEEKRGEETRGEERGEENREEAKDRKGEMPKWVWLTVRGHPRVTFLCLHQAA